MKAIVHTAYGPPDELELREVEKPVPEDDEVLIKIHATSVTTTDCNIRNMTFLPALLRLPMRLQFGWTKPTISVLGVDLAGEVEAVGNEVTRFKNGDRVYGASEPGFGGHAQYICMPEDGVITNIPANMTYEQAAAVPLAWHTALHFIKDQVNIQAGQKVLIIGASGAVGTFAVQLAKNFGAEVTGVCSTKNVEMVKSLGADYVIDYSREDFTKCGESYDVVFDAVHKYSFLRCRNVLKDKGLYLVTMPSLTFLLQTLLTTLIGNKKIKNGSREATQEDLLSCNQLFEAGDLTIVIGRTYPLEEIPEAFRHVEGGHKVGNVVITVGHD